MSMPGEFSVRFVPRGVCDTVDGDNSAPGACASLQNLIFDQGTPGLLVCRPASTSLSDFSLSGLPASPGAAGVISAAYQVNSIIYGMVAITSAPYVYVANQTDGTVSVINPATGLLVKTITVGADPIAVAVSPSGGEVWVCNYTSGTISVISTTSLTVVATITIGAGIYGLAFTPDGTKVYVTRSTTSRVYPVTVSSRAVGATITVGSTPRLICITPDGLKAYVANGGASTVSVITIASNTVTATISVGLHPEGVAPTPDSSHVWVTNTDANTVSIIKTSDGTVAGPVTVGASPEGVAVTPDGAHVYVANTGATTISVLETVGNTVTATITTTLSAPKYVAINAAGSTVYVTGSGSGAKVAVIATASNTVTGYDTVGANPDGIAVAQTSDFTGLDYPFAYNTVGSVFCAVSGITAASLPTSQATSGDWTPPQFTLTGIKLVLTHPGFSGVSYYFGALDLTTPSLPAWFAGNTTTHGLPTVPVCCGTFNNRTWFGCANTAYFTDTLALAMTNANQSLSFDDLTPITTMAPLPMGSTSQAVIQALLLFKGNKVSQVTGDASNSPNNLAQNLLSTSVGTTAPRSVVPTPSGVKFLAADGIRNIDFYGTVSEPDPDLAIPFIYALHPSRACAAYNSDVFRICVQNSKTTGNPYEDYWYDLKRGGWTGPHSFRYDVAVPLDNDFALASNSVVAKLWDSDIVQGHLGGGSTFVENGTQLAWTYKPTFMTDLDNLYANKVVRSSLEMMLPSTGGSVVFTAISASGGTLAQGTVQLPQAGSFWNAFTWGSGLWGVNVSGLAPYSIPWNQAVVFNKLQTQASGNSALSLALGGWHFGYKRLNYMLQ